MTTEFNSFDRSPAGAFVESRAGARNRVPLIRRGTNDPIIFILPTVQTLNVREYSVKYSWVTWPQEIPWVPLSEVEATPLPYSINPDDFERDVADMEAAFVEHANFNYRGIGRLKPNWNVMIWQPTAAKLTGQGSYLLGYTTSPVGQGNYNTHTSPPMSVFNSNQSVRLLAGPNHAGDLPRATPYQIPLNTLQSVVSVISGPFGPIVGHRDGPAGSVRLEDPIPVGPYDPANREFLPQRSLIDVWGTVQQRYESISPLWVRRSEIYNSQVFIYTPGPTAYRRFTHSWTSLSIRQPGLPPGATPLSQLRDYLEDELLPELRPVRVTIRQGGSRWPVHVASVIRDRMRG